MSFFYVKIFYILSCYVTHMMSVWRSYFKIMSMISTKTRADDDATSTDDDKTFLFGVEKMDPNRCMIFRQIEQNAIGTKEWAFMSSAKFIKMMIQGVMTKPKQVCTNKNCPKFNELNSLRVRANYIDEEKVNVQKQMLQDSVNGTYDASTFHGKANDVKFISTQDIITSSWFNASSSRLPMFTINLRKRCPELSTKLVGNYETSIIVDPPSYERAPLIRKALQSKPHFTRADPAPLPGFCGKTSCAFITTWCFSIEGNPSGLYLENCQQLLHMPIMPVSILKMCPMDFAVVFRATHDKRAILMFCKEATDKTLMNSPDSVLGGIVGEEMFHDPIKDPPEWHEC